MKKVTFLLIIAFVIALTSCNESKTDIDALKKNANDDNVEAQVELAQCYYKGKDVKQDKEKALFWYKKAADKGNKDAIYFFDEFYNNARTAAEKGDANGQCNLGI